MSSMQRSMRRSIARKRGTFVAQKPLRDRTQRTFKQMFLEAVMKNKWVKSLMKANKEIKK